MDPAARVVMVTADVQASTRTLAETGGAVGFVVKPLATAAVLRAVDDALAGQLGGPA
jgi:DNA-binding NarL/FixJ family response regulator